MPVDTSPVLDAPPFSRAGRFSRSVAGVIGLSFLAMIFLVCVATLPYTLARVAVDPADPGAGSTVRYDAQDRLGRTLPPSWWPAKPDPATAERQSAVAAHRALQRLALSQGKTVDQLAAAGVAPTPDQVAAARPFYLMGTDLLGRSLLIRSLTGGGISLTIGIAAALLSVLLGTFYGALSGYIGGRLDAVMMRIVDILYGLPYILLVVLLAVAVDARLEHLQTLRVKRIGEQKQAYIQRALAALPEGKGADPASRQRAEQEAAHRFGTGELSASSVQAINIITLLVAIGGVSWLTMARVVRGQVLSLKAQPFIEAARAMGVPLRRIFLRHLLPNLVGPIVVYATLTVPQAILQESFLSFLGIGVHPPLPSWGNLAADGLQELNRYKSNWWLLFFPCVLLACTLLSLNFVGEGLREALDPKRRNR